VSIEDSKDKVVEIEADLGYEGWQHAAASLVAAKQNN